MEKLFWEDKKGHILRAEFFVFPDGGKIFKKKVGVGKKKGGDKHYTLKQRGGGVGVAFLYTEYYFF